MLFVGDIVERKVNANWKRQKTKQNNVQSSHYSALHLASFVENAKQCMGGKSPANQHQPKCLFWKFNGLNDSVCTSAFFINLKQEEDRFSYKIYRNKTISTLKWMEIVSMKWFKLFVIYFILKSVVSLFCISSNLKLLSHAFQWVAAIFTIYERFCLCWLTIVSMIANLIGMHKS